MSKNIFVQPQVKVRIENYLKGEGISNYTININPIKPKGNNYLGITAKVTVTGKGKGENITLNWIVKYAPQSDTLRKYSQIDRLYKREIFVYEKLLPIFKGLQEENDIIEPFATTAKLYLRSTDTYQECVLLQDMNALGFNPVSRQKPLDLAHVQSVMKMYGKLHALSFALRQERPDELKQLSKDLKENYNTNAYLNVISVQQRKCCNMALETLNPSSDRSVIEKFKKFVENSFEVQTEALKLGALGAHSVILHGDSRISNMLFKYDDPERPNIPTDICLLDWQFCRYGSPALDLSHFLFTVTDKKFRDSYYKQMIQTYYFSLCSYLTELGCDAEKLFPFSILELQLKRYSIYGLCMALRTLHITLSEDEDSPDWSGAITEADIDESFNCNPITYNDYKIRIRDVINDFIDYGYFEFLN